MCIFVYVVIFVVGGLSFVSVVILNVECGNWLIDLIVVDFNIFEEVFV